MFTPRREGVLMRCPELLRPDVADQMNSAVRVAVGMAIQAGYTAAGMLGAAILGLVVLLLRKDSKKKAEAVDLLRVENAVEQFVVVVEGDQLALGDVAEVGP